MVLPFHTTSTRTIELQVSFASKQIFIYREITGKISATNYWQVYRVKQKYPELIESDADSLRLCHCCRPSKRSCYQTMNMTSHHSLLWRSLQSEGRNLGLALCPDSNESNWETTRIFYHKDCCSLGESKLMLAATFCCENLFSLIIIMVL